jgi:hypothetical protein
MRQLAARALLVAATSAAAVAAQQPNPGGVAPERTSHTYRAVVDGMTCRQQRQLHPGGPRVQCDYRVGRSLHFVIPGVGEPDVAVTFLKVDADGDYHASVGAGSSHRCVVVTPGRSRPGYGAGIGRSDAAFVSPQTGKVHASWQECAAGSSRRVAVRRTPGPVDTVHRSRRASVRRPATQVDVRRRPPQQP